VLAELRLRFPVTDVPVLVFEFGFLVSGFGYLVSGFGFRVSGFGFRVSGFGFRASGRKRVRCHRTSFWRQISARPSTFSVLCPYTVLKNSVSAVLNHFQKRAK